MLLDLDKSEEMLEAEEPTDYAYEVTGKVIGLDGSDRRSIAGKFRLYYMDLAAAYSDHESVFDVFDGRAETLDYFYEIFETTDSTIWPSPKLEALLGGGLYLGNVLILDRLEILPQFRGHNLGLIVMRRLIERFRQGAEIVAIKPFPLQLECEPRDVDRWRNRLRLNELGRNNSQATAKLRRYYRKLGFKHMRGTPFMFRLTGTPLPKIPDLEK